MTLSATGTYFADNHVYALYSPQYSTSNNVFGNSSEFGDGDNIRRYWSLGVIATLRIDFALPAKSVSIDAVGPSATGFGRLEAYDAVGALLTSFDTPGLATGVVGTMTVSAPEYSIAYVLAGGQPSRSGVHLDNLQADVDVVPEPGSGLVWLLLGFAGLSVIWRRRRKAA